MRRFVSTLILALIFLCTLAHAHPGGRDRFGGHRDREAGGYHFHEGPLAGQAFPSKETAFEALNALAAPHTSAETPTQPPPPPAEASSSSAPAAAVAGNTRIESFSKAKRLAVQVYAGRQKTFYCGCSYEGKVVDLESCGYKVKKNLKRARRLEWEHVVPAHAFGQSFPEWRDGHPDCVDRKGKQFKGRNCAGKVSREFRLMEADLYNLQPAIGEVNGLRSNYSMAMIPGEAREFGECDVEIEDGKVEPRPEIRGDIARTYMYMDAAYPGHGIISRRNRKLFEAWGREDPVDEWERERAKRIEQIQGNRNPFVK